MAREPSPTVCRRRLAAELRRFREDARLNGVQVAKQLKWSTSKISRLETGQILPQRGDVESLLRRYAVDGETAERLLTLTEIAQHKGWWEDYADILSETLLTFIGLEAGAAEVRSWQSTVVPGLLQTSDYARAGASILMPLEAISPGEVERRTRLRLGRQQLLTAEDPLVYDTVIDEAVLLRRYGDEGVMRDQLHHLLKLTESPTITIRVLRLKGPHPADWSSFLHMRFPAVDGLGALYEDVVYTEAYSAQVLEEREEITHRYARIFDLLAEAALGEDESRELIADLADAIEC
ncbi:helix-turn-helix domain-containing protein [Sphaerisporangium aureirubrum]|uniref:Helix-turn-helix domain-containing protein n=1 Tax=Sphaerisporangium aureirubrum TaxID=1544736 RepID=A0ABW1NKD0_9ACTN